MKEKTALRIQKWLEGPYDSASKEEIRQLNSDALNDAFYRDLSFGTGGMRALMGVGTNRINIYTIRMATQGLANYLLQEHGRARVFIGYDVRHNSFLFAKESARVLAGNNIEAFLTREICPTPLASFGCRHFNCQAAIMITASHNPPEYNGYKVYGSDGAQIVPPVDGEIIAQVRKIQSPDQVRLGELDSSFVHWVGSEIDSAYLQELGELAGDVSLKKLSILYTNLHGTGVRIVPAALRSWGFYSLSSVEAQAPLDGSFQAAPSPNPEEESALSLGIQQMLETRADLLLATDPDADRVGLAIRQGNRAVRFNGNEIACICLAHLLKRGLPERAAILKTIVTTELLSKMAESYRVRCIDVLTGFKYIAQEIRSWEENGAKHQFLFGAEESHGYLLGTFVRDKDAIGASCLIAAAAEEEKAENRTLLDALYDLYRRFGVHRQSLYTMAFADSPTGMEAMGQLMKKLRTSRPSAIGKSRIVQFDDLLQETALPRSDVLRFWLEDQTRVVIRPSGTEPKLKIYLEASDPPGLDLQTSIQNCDQRLKQTMEHFRQENGV